MKTKLKILVVTQYFWPEQFRINDIVKSMLKNGHQVDVLTGSPNYPNRNLFNDYKYSKKYILTGEIISLWK